LARTLELRSRRRATRSIASKRPGTASPKGEKLAPLRVLTLRDLPLLLRTLTPARWALMEALRSSSPTSIYELAKRLHRDYKNVHTDVSRLIELG